MNNGGHALVGKLYDLHVERFNYQSNEIDALHRALQSLCTSHELIGQMLTIINALSRKDESA
jgi:hypothetical protein